MEEELEEIGRFAELADMKKFAGTVCRRVNPFDPEGFRVRWVGPIGDTFPSQRPEAEAQDATQSACLGLGSCHVPPGVAPWHGQSVSLHEAGCSHTMCCVTGILHSSVYSPTGGYEARLCPVRALGAYLHRMSPWRRSVQLFGSQLRVFGPDDHLVAKAGKDLVLPCYIKPSTSVDEMTVRWLKQETKHTLVHLYKDHEDRNEDQAQSYRKRTSLFKEELQKGNASLRLSDLRVSDEGEYMCFIGDESWSDDITFYVTVKVLGSPPVIMMDSRVEGDPDGTVTEPGRNTAPRGGQERGEVPVADWRRRDGHHGALERSDGPGGDRRRRDDPGGDPERSDAPGGDRRRRDDPCGGPERNDALGGDRRRSDDPCGDPERNDALGGDRRRSDDPCGDPERNDALQEMRG
ncbi:butyrophilin, subfamily 1, member A1 precursor [Silurus meridionalis]|nr:butyrophilin, subfamily 1, member A1 precursor [Silurus meridionalis]